MDPGLPTIPMEEQEWCLNGWCIAAGLPPFPCRNYYFLHQDRQMDDAAMGFDLSVDATPLQHKSPPLADAFRLPELETAEMGLAATATAAAAAAAAISGRAHPLLLLPPPLLASTKRPRSPPVWKGKRTAESVAARKRRRGISERTTILAGLMPWERKMSICAMLEEAHKYVRFLEAQVTALGYMPQHSYSFSNTGHHHTEAGGYGALDLLNRQRLLEVLVNSALVQERLYKEGLCVCSVEQMLLMRKTVERRGLVVEQESGCSTVSD